MNRRSTNSRAGTCHRRDENRAAALVGGDERNGRSTGTDRLKRKHTPPRPVQARLLMLFTSAWLNAIADRIHADNKTQFACKVRLVIGLILCSDQVDPKRVDEFLAIIKKNRPTLKGVHPPKLVAHDSLPPTAQTFPSPPPPLPLGGRPTLPSPPPPLPITRRHRAEHVRKPHAPRQDAKLQPLAENRRLDQEDRKDLRGADLVGRPIGLASQSKVRA